jgi:sugar phosphate permease
MFWKHRFTVLGLLYTATGLCYLDRMVMASALPFIAKELNLSPLRAGLVLSAFFVGYAVSQIPGGLMADRYGPRPMLTGTILWWSVMTGLTALAPGLLALLLTRILFGLGEGPFPPAAYKAMAVWVPRAALGRASGLQQAATAVGATVAPLFVATAVLRWGWRSSFYLLIVPGFALAFLMWRHVRNSPQESGRVPARELADYGLPSAPTRSGKTTLATTLRMPAVAWCAISFFLANSVAWGLMNWLPTYLLGTRGFSVQKMGFYAAVTNLAGVAGYVLGGYLCDRYFRNCLKVPIITGLLVSTAFTYLAAIAPDGVSAVCCLVPVFLFSNVVATALSTIPLVMVPKHAVGAAFGVVNTAGQLSGILSPLLIGWVLTETKGRFEIVLYGMVALTLIAIYPASRIRQSVARAPSPAAA